MMTRKELTPVDLSNVTIDGPFWAQRMKINRERTIPHEYKMCKETGRIDSLIPGWKPPTPEVRYYWYATIYGWIEAASYSLIKYPDAKLESLIDDLIELIVKRQKPDGYMPGSYKDVEPEDRWEIRFDVNVFYSGGRLLSAAVAHSQATGKRTLLDVACRFADYVDTVFGPGKKRGSGPTTPFMKLYQVTGGKRYATLAKFFLDQRGRRPNYLDLEARARGKEPAPYWSALYYDREAKATGRGEDLHPFWEAPNLGIGAYGWSPVRTIPDEMPYEKIQAHKPVREQDKAVGHAAGAVGLYSAMADVAAEFGDEELRVACDRLWDHLTSKRMYITGGIGSSKHNEGFTKDYDLPNETAYCETCSAVGFVSWAHRMLQFECNGRYADIMERVLYNSLLSGVSLDGEKFNYVNPLASTGNHHRQEWFDCPCCPPNIMRLIASLGGYVYSQSETDAVVHLYAGGTASLCVAGQTVSLHIDTRYPWDEKVVIRVDPETPASFGLKLRIPGWCPEFSLKVNGREMKSIKPQRGYLRIEREWKADDHVEFNLSIPIELVRAHPEVREDIGCVAIQRGPIVYCLEQVDNKVSLHRIVLPEDARLEARFEPDLLDGVVVIYGDALYDSGWDGQLYHVAKEQHKPFKIKAIPFYAWDNRESGEMRVWVRLNKY